MKFYNYKYRFALMLLPALLVYNITLAQKPKATKLSPKIVFFDDFSGKGLDRSKWNVEITGMHVNNELQAYIDSAATIYTVKGAAAAGAVNGALVIRPQYAKGYKTKDGKTFDFISGRINTNNKFDFTYGLFEARIKLTAGSGLWPAWWILGKGVWPETGEIDIMEYVGESDWASAAVHGPGYSGETPFVNRQYFDNNNDATQWHIYAVEWTPNTLNFIYDGKLMFRVNRKMAEHYGKWAFDNPKYLILNYALGGAYPIKLNGATSPYNGLPFSTLDIVKRNQAKMLVDWVRVTQK